MSFNHNKFMSSATTQETINLEPYATDEIVDVIETRVTALETQAVNNASNTITTQLNTNTIMCKTGNEITIHNRINMKSEMLGLLRLNSRSVTGGQYLVIGDSTRIMLSGTKDVYNILYGVDFTGSLTLPSNTISFSNYHFGLSGIMSISYADSLTFKLLSNGGIVGILVIASLPALTLSHFKIDIDLTVQYFGIASPCVTNFTFSAGQGIDHVTYRQVATGYIDTTISNILTITLESPSAGEGNFFIRTGILTKTY